MTPNFQIWYLTSMDMILREQGREPGAWASDTSPVPCALSPGPPLAEVSFSPCEQPWRRVRFALIVGRDLQRGQIHAQQLRNAFAPEDVPVFVQNLQKNAAACEDKLELERHLPV